MKRDMALAALVGALLLGHAGAASAQRAGVTRQEFFARADRQFPRIDTDHSGSVTLSELTAALTARGTASPAEAAARMMRRADTNRDGMLSIDEYRALMAARFSRNDKNGNGVIDAEEAKEPAGDE